MSIATETETLEQEVNRRVSQFIADNPRFTNEKDFLILQTVALIGVSAALTMMDRAEPDPEVELFHSEQEQLDEQRFFLTHPNV